MTGRLARRAVRAVSALWIVALAAGGAAGPPRAEKSQRVAYAGRSLVEALEQLRVAGLPLVYSSELVRGDLIVAVEPRAARPRDVLEELLAPHGLEARAGPGGLLLVLKAPQRGGIRGHVQGAGAAGPLAGARVRLSGVGVETTTDAAGLFEAGALRPGTYAVQAVAPGYRLAKLDGVPVSPGRVTEVRLFLEPMFAAHESVRVRAQDATAERASPAPWDHFGQERLAAAPGPGNDALHVTGSLPGIALRDESARLNVRGGDSDEVLIVLDGVELYDPFHLKDHQGLFSIVDSRAVGRVDVVGGAFPAEYGGRMSGVVSIESTPPAESLATEIDVGSSDARIASQGTFVQDRARWLVSARRGFPLETLEALSADPTYDPRYSDVFATVAWDASDRSRLSANVLAAVDDLEHPGVTIVEGAEPGNFLSRYRTSYGWVGLSRLWSTRMHSRTILSWGELDQRRTVATEGGDSTADHRSTRILGLKQDWAFDADRHFVKWGLDLKRLDADYRYLEAPAGGQDGTEILRQPAGTEVGLYVDDRFRATPGLTLEAGVRWDGQTYAPDGRGRISPRLNLLQRIGARDAIRLGWGYFRQPQRIHEIQIADGAADYFAPQRAEHRLIGFEHAFRSGPELRLAAYDKVVTHVRPRYENLFDPLGLFPEAAADRVLTDPTRARAAGVELGLRGPIGRRLGWSASYALASAEELDDGRWVPRSWDQRHELDWALDVKSGRGWQLVVAGAHRSGRPTTPVTTGGQEPDDGSIEPVPIVGPRNSERLPAYHRIDLRVGHALFPRGTELRYFLDITNVLDRDNACCVAGFDLQPDADGAAGARPEYRYGLSRLLSYGVTWRF
jgi:outer membrane receptor protein involved in Fe transport